MHPITSFIRDAEMFDWLKWFQDRYIPRKVLFVTTKWDVVGDHMAIAEARERELLDTTVFWRWARSKGAEYRRHNNTRESALNILGDIVDQSSLSASHCDDVSDVPRSEAQHSSSKPSSTAAKQEECKDSKDNVNEADDESINPTGSSEVSFLSYAFKYVRLIL